MENKSFRQRYKKLTGYNLKYYLISSDNSDPTEIGTCTIVSWYEKRKRKMSGRVEHSLKRMPSILLF